MKRMAFVDLTDFHSWPVGGMLRYEEQILPILATKYKIDLWGVKVNDTQTQPVMINGKAYPVHIFAHVRTSKRILPNYWKGLQLFFKRSVFRRYDIVYIHTGSMVVAAAMWRHRGDQLLVYHQHGLQYLDDHSLKTLLQRPFMFLAQRLADFTFVVTGKEELAQFVKGKSIRKKMVQISSPSAIGIQPAVQDHKKAAHKVFIYTGRMSAIKRVPVLIEAFNEFCKRRGGGYKLLLVGDGEERKLVEKAIENSPYQQNIVLTGNVNKQEVERYLLEADYYLTASKGEGASVAVLEAFQAGLPVVCCAVRGLKEQVKDQYTGVIASEDTATAFADAMERMVIIADTLRKNCILEGSKYKPEAIAGQIIQEIGVRYEQHQHKCDHSCL